MKTATGAHAATWRMGWRVPLVLCAIVAASCGGGGADSSTGELPIDALVVTGGTVIDGSGAAAISDGLVAMQQGHVVAVGPATDFVVSGQAEVIDVAGGTILPGFVDAHVHEAADPAIRRDFLEGGVTSVCAMGSRLEDIPLYAEDRVEETPVARAFQAGPIMTAPGGAPDIALDIGYNYEVSSPAEARAGVADLLERGTDVIKVYLLAPEVDGQPIPVLDEMRLEAIVDEAHGRGVLVRAHITDVSVLEMALGAGVDVVDHVPWLTPTADEVASIGASDDPIRELRNMLDISGSEALWDSMAQAGTVLVPTLDRGIASRFPNNQPSDEVVRLYLDSVRQFHQFGGIVALGTDFNVNLEMTRGIPVTELQLLSEAGLSLMEVIEAGTRHAAYVCGHDDELGTLEPGKLGDLIVITSDPLRNIKALEDVNLVIKDGSIAFEAP